MLLEIAYRNIELLTSVRDSLPYTHTPSLSLSLSLNSSTQYLCYGWRKLKQVLGLFFLFLFNGEVSADLERVKLPHVAYDVLHGFTCVFVFHL